MRARPDPAVSAWMRIHAGETILSTIVLAELRYGIALAVEPQRTVFQAFHDDLHVAMAGRIADFDDAAAAAWAELRSDLKKSGRLIGERDMFIAAHALSLDTPLVTRNVSDMARTGAVIIDPWQA